MSVWKDTFDCEETEAELQRRWDEAVSGKQGEKAAVLECSGDERTVHCGKDATSKRLFDMLAEACQNPQQGDTK